MRPVVFFVFVFFQASAIYGNLCSQIRSTENMLLVTFLGNYLIFILNLMLFQNYGKTSKREHV